MTTSISWERPEIASLGDSELRDGLAAIVSDPRFANYRLAGKFRARGDKVRGR